MTDKPMPIDKADESLRAVKTLRRFRKALNEFPEPWRKWIAQSLAAGCETEDEAAE